MALEYTLDQLKLVEALITRGGVWTPRMPELDRNAPRPLAIPLFDDIMKILGLSAAGLTAILIWLDDNNLASVRWERPIISASGTRGMRAPARSKREQPNADEWLLLQLSLLRSGQYLYEKQLRELGIPMLRKGQVRGNGSESLEVLLSHIEQEPHDLLLDEPDEPSEEELALIAAEEAAVEAEAAPPKRSHKKAELAASVPTVSSEKPADSTPTKAAKKAAAKAVRNHPKGPGIASLGEWRPEADPNGDYALLVLEVLDHHGPLKTTGYDVLVDLWRMMRETGRTMPNDRVQALAELEAAVVQANSRTDVRTTRFAESGKLSRLALTSAGLFSLRRSLADRTHRRTG